MKNSRGFFFVSFLSGFVFALGLSIGGMLNPVNVQGFLDVYDWNPSLLGVMGGAALVYFVANRIALTRVAPVFASDWSQLPKIGFNLPLRVILGNILFGVGWAISGYCPGPAIASIATLSASTFFFVGSMIAGFIVWELFLKKI